MNRLTKQITYGFLFIALVIGAVLLGGWLVKIANAPVELPVDITNQTKEIQITNWQEIKSAKNSLLSDYIIELYNPNSEKGAEKIGYSLGTTKGESYILPLEKKFVVVMEEQRNLAKEDFVISEVLWIDFSKQESAELSVKEKKFLAEDKEVNSSSVFAVVSNKGKYDFAVVDVNIIIYNLEKNPAAVLQTQVSKLFSGQEQYFKVFWPNFINENIGEVFIQASSNIMNADNTKIYSESIPERFNFNDKKTNSQAGRV